MVSFMFPILPISFLLLTNYIDGWGGVLLFFKTRNSAYYESPNPRGLWIRGGPSIHGYHIWLTQLFEDPDFEQAVKIRWNNKKAGLELLLNEILKKSFDLRLPAEQNFSRWDILDRWVWPNAVVLGTYKAEVDYLISWLRTRISWLDTEINSW